jgi:hypothetical protein
MEVCAASPPAFTLMPAILGGTTGNLTSESGRWLLGNILHRLAEARDFVGSLAKRHNGQRGFEALPALGRSRSTITRSSLPQRPGDQLDVLRNAFPECSQ